MPNVLRKWLSRLKPGGRSNGSAVRSADRSRGGRRYVPTPKLDSNLARSQRFTQPLPSKSAFGS
jgi:hypothetical protein